MLRRPFFYGWYIVAVGVLVHIAGTFSFSSTLSIFLKPITEELEVSRGLFSLIRTAEIGVAALLVPVLGPVVDRYGGLDAILAALADPQAGFAAGVRGKLTGARDYLTAAATVVRVARDVDLGDVDTALPQRPRHPDRLDELVRECAVAGPTRRLAEALDAAGQWRGAS